MATWTGAVHVLCLGCGWHGTRVPRDPADPNHGEVGGFSPCPRCQGSLRRGSVRVDQQAAKAKAELQELAHGGRV